MLLDVVNLERWIVAILAAGAWWWTFRGVRELAQGKFWPPSFYLSAIFWLSAGTFSFEPAHVAQLGGASPAIIEWWRMVNVLFLIIGLLCAHIGHRRGDTLKARQFYRMYDHLGEALAIADLSTVDPEAGKRMAEECRRLTAEKIFAHG